MGRRCAVGADGSGLACCTLLLGFKGPTLRSAVFAPFVMMWRQQGLSEVSDSHDSVLVMKSFKKTLRLSLSFLCGLRLYACRDKVLHRGAALGCGHRTCGRRRLPISVDHLKLSLSFLCGLRLYACRDKVLHRGAALRCGHRACGRRGLPISVELCAW